MTKKLLFTAVLLTLLTPNLAHAYLNPEDVLLSRELFLPPTSRDAQERTEIQASEAAARREREQQRAFELQHPVSVEEPQEPETLFGSAPEMQPMQGYYAYPVPVQGGNALFPQALFGAAPAAGLTESANLELMRTMRLLSRVNQNQVASEFQQQVLHSSAGNLSDTGAGSILAAVTMLGAVLYTIRRAKKSEQHVQVLG